MNGEPTIEAGISEPGKARISRMHCFFQVTFGLFLVLFIIPFPLTFIPGAEVVEAWVDAAILPITEKVGPLFSLHPVLEPTGSGDTAFNYLKLLVILVLSMAIAAAFIPRSITKERSERLETLIRIFVRYFLGAIMLTYGLGKVLPLQFPMPSADRLLTSYGDSSPMGLVWRLMGLSPIYSAIAGACEAVGGYLLFFRRTTTFGGFLLVPVMFNIMFLNYCYDIPVKLHSTMYCLMLVFLLWGDGWTIAKSLWKRTAIPFTEHRPPFKNPKITFAVKALLLLLIFGQQFFQLREEIKMIATMRKPSGFSGAYSSKPVGANQSATTADWTQVFISPKGQMVAINTRGDTLRFKIVKTKDPAKFDIPDDKRKGEITLVALDKERITLDGTIGGDKFQYVLTKIDDARAFLVLNRGFHWIQEKPFHK